MKRTMPALLAVVALAGCGGSSSSSSALPVTEGSSAASVVTPTPSDFPSPATAVGPGATAAQVAAALGCGNAKPKAIKPGSGSSIPDPTSEVSCTDTGIAYVVTVYASESDLTSVLLFSNMLLAGTLRKPWTFGAGDTWVIGGGAGKAFVSLPPSMASRVEAAGGVVKAIKPS